MKIGLKINGNFISLNDQHLNLMKWLLFLSVILLASPVSAKHKDIFREKLIAQLRESVIAKADSLLKVAPKTVTSYPCVRSAGGIHDFYSEGDYWWPDPANPGGPYIQKDGQSNPDNFSAHRHALIRLSEITATLTSAWLLTKEPEYAEKALEHLTAWFTDTATRMNPHMLFAQAISGRYTGRGIGLIDAYHLVEVAQSINVLSENGCMAAGESEKIKSWFGDFLHWMTTHPYGIDEMNAKNNHGTCWVATAAIMAVLTGDQTVVVLCRNRFKKVLLPGQMAADGSFPLELKRTKPYAYSLFNMDAFCTIAQILSTQEDNLWEYCTPDGRSLKKGMDFIYPYIAVKERWPFAKDIYIWEEWPARQSSLLFSGFAWQNEVYLQTYMSFPANPTHPEVIRNLPVRHPVIWLAGQGVDGPGH